MKKNIIADKLDELYRKENIYSNPIQSRPKPRPGITGKKPDDEDLGTQVNSGPTDEEDVTKDLGLKGNEKDLGLKGDEEDLGRKKKSEPKNWEFEGPRDSIHQED